LGTALSTLMLNPVILGLTALAGVIAMVTVNMQKARQSQEELTRAQEEYQRIVREGIKQSEVASTEEKITRLEDLKKKYQELIEVARKSEEAQSGEVEWAISDAAEKLGVDIAELDKAAAEFDVTLQYLNRDGKIVAVSMDQLAQRKTELTKAIKDATRGTTAEINEKAKQIAMQNRENMTIENLLKQYKAAKTGSSDWNQAQSELAKMFPQFSTAVGINEEAIQGLLIVKKQEVQTAWASVQAKAAEILMEKRKEIATKETAVAVAEASMTWSTGMVDAANATQKLRGEITALKGEVSSLEALMNIDPSKLTGVQPVESPKEPKTSSQYENKALDQAYRLFEHKKRLNQLTLEDELKTLESIKAKHVKTADERMDIDEKIFEVRSRMMDASMESALHHMEREKQLGIMNEDAEIARLERIKQKYADTSEDRLKIDDMIFDAQQRKKDKALEAVLNHVEREKQLGMLTTDQEIARLEAIGKKYAYTADQKQSIDDKLFDARVRKIEEQKQIEVNALSELTRSYKETVEDRLLMENLTAEQRFQVQNEMYNNIVTANEIYLSKVLSDDKYTAKEKEQIQKDITATIRQNINERLQLEKNYYSEIQKQEIDSINKLSQGIQSALREKYQAEKKAEDDRIKGLLEANEQWKKDATEIAKSMYDARIKAAEDAANAEIAAIESVLNAQIKAIQDELTALEEAEKQKSRAELDADDQKKIDRLQSKLDYEHDEFNKVQLQKEINKVIADRDKRHQQEQLQDKKDALKSEEQTLKEKLKEQTDAIKQQLAQKKEMLAADRDAEIERINLIAEQQKNSLNEMLKKHQEHYDELLKAKYLQAEAEKMIVQNQQDDIIKLLEGFGESYQITGQTLGEKMYQGFKDKVSQISTLIAQINGKIDAARNAAVSALNQAQEAAAASKNTVNNVQNTKTVNVQNTFSSPVTSPSDISRATQKMGQKLMM